MIRKEFDLGIVHPMIYPDTHEENVIKSLCSLLEDDYFNTLEIGRLPERVKSSVIHKIRNSKIRVIYSGHGSLLKNNLNLNSLDETVRQESIQMIKSELDEAASYGSRLFTLLSGNYEEESIKAHMSALSHSLKEVCDYARERYQMTVALEPFDYDIDKKSLIGPSHRAKEIAQMVGRENFGFLVDLSHIPMIGEDISHTLITLGDHIVHLHIGSTILDEDSDLYGDSHPRFGHESGSNDTPQVREFLQEAVRLGYLDRHRKPTLSFEVKPYGQEESEVIIANSKRTLREAWLSLSN